MKKKHTQLLKKAVKILLIIFLIIIVFNIIIPLFLIFVMGWNGQLFYWPVSSLREFEIKKKMFQIMTTEERLKIVTYEEKTVDVDSWYQQELKYGKDGSYFKNRIDKNGYCYLGGKYGSWYSYITTNGFNGEGGFVLTCNNGLAEPYKGGEFSY